MLAFTDISLLKIVDAKKDKKTKLLFQLKLTCVASNLLYGDFSSKNTNWYAFNALLR